MNLIKLFGLAAVLGTLWACQAAPSTDNNDAGVLEQSASRAEYRLDNGDKLKVTVFGEPDLSGEFLVDGTGTLSMPLAGEVTVAGMTLRDFQRTLEAKLIDEQILIDPKVSAEVINYRPYYILGEVGKPGEYPYTSGLTVMNAVATAEGFSYRANKRVVFIKSSESDEETAIRLTPNTKVQPGDTIRIGERLF